MTKGIDIILDTHILILLMSGDERLKRKAILTKIKERASFGRIYVSPLSFWELGMLQEQGKIEVSMPTEDWVAKALDAPGVRVAPLTIEIAAGAGHLYDGKLSASDQILLATAQEMRLSLATLNKYLRGFAQKHRIEVL